MEPLPQPAEPMAPTPAAPAAALAPWDGWRRRAGDWVRILSAYFTAQSLTQLLGFAAGLLYINFLPVREFALYTLASSVINFLTFASDLGSTTSLLYFYNQTAREEHDFTPYLAAVRSLRRAAFLAGALAVVVGFPAFVLARGFRPGETSLATLAILLCVWAQIGSSLRLLALRLGNRYARSYRAEVAGGSVRLAGAALIVATGALRAGFGLLTSALAAAAVSRLARGEEEGTRVRDDLAPYRRRVLRYLLPTLPSALYFSLQGPLIVWLAATFGKTHNVAEVGALSRLGLVVGMFSGLVGVVFLPRLARTLDERAYRRRFFQYGSLLALVAVALFGVAALAPQWFLLLLGPHYAGLQRELLLVVATSGLSLIGGYCVNVNLARCWTRWQVVTLAGEIAATAALVAVLPLTTTAGVLWLSLLGVLVGVTFQFTINLVGLRRPAWVRWT